MAETAEYPRHASAIGAQVPSPPCSRQLASIRTGPRSSHFNSEWTAPLRMPRASSTPKTYSTIFLSTGSASTGTAPDERERVRAGSSGRGV